MKRTSFPGPAFMALWVGLASLAKFAPGVRTVAVVGLFAGGVAAGAGMMRTIMWYRGEKQ